MTDVNPRVALPNLIQREVLGLLQLLISATEFGRIIELRSQIIGVIGGAALTLGVGDESGSYSMQLQDWTVGAPEAPPGPTPLPNRSARRKKAS